MLTVRGTRNPGKLPGVDADGVQLSAIAFGALAVAINEGLDLGW